MGAIATQAYANPRYGPDGLALLREGLSRQEVVDRLTSADDEREHRQLGVVDGRGGSATFTGTECMDWAGGAIGPGYAAQGNILVGEETVAALASTFESTDRAAARRTADRLPRRSAGSRRRPARPAVCSALRRRARRRLRGPFGRPRRPSHRRPRAARRRARPAVRDAHPALRQDRASGSTSTTRFATSSTERLHALGYDGDLERCARRVGGHREPRGAPRRRRADRCGRARGAARTMSGYEVLSLDELGSYPDARYEGAPRLIPLRYELGLRAFGANAWTNDVGGHVVPRHSEESGNEELYVVVRGRATFTVNDETLDAPAGTLVHAVSGENREAVAEEPGTIVLAVGATRGQPFDAARLGRGGDRLREGGRGRHRRQPGDDRGAPGPPAGRMAGPVQRRLLRGACTATPTAHSRTCGAPSRWPATRCVPSLPETATWRASTTIRVGRS